MPIIERNDIIQFLRAEIEQRSGIADADLENDALLSTLGLSSLDIVLISGAVEDHFNIDVDPTIMYEYPTISGITDRLSATIPLHSDEPLR